MGRLSGTKFKVDVGSLAYKMASAPLSKDKQEPKHLSNKEFIKNWKESTKEKK